MFIIGWKLTHNIFYIGNVYADILKIIEKYNLTYGDWDCLQNIMKYSIEGSCKSRAEKLKDGVSFREAEPQDFSDYDYIKYDNVIPEGKYPIYDKDDYFIKNPYSKLKDGNW